jgi:hypothetical protein
VSAARHSAAILRRGHRNYPRHGLGTAVRPNRALIRHCPRCVTRSRNVVDLFISTLPADALDGERSLRRFSDERASVTASRAW